MAVNDNPLAASDFDVWKSWGVNLVRFNFEKDDTADVYSGNPTNGDVWQPYQSNLIRLDTLLGWLKDRNMTAMVSMDTLWGDDHNSNLLWSGNGINPYLDHRIQVTKAMAEWLYTNHSEVKFLEVWNEPHPIDHPYTNYYLPAVISNIRLVNPAITIVVMPPYDWGSIWGFAGWSGVSGSNIQYSTHIYSPWTYTHQGIYGNPLLQTGWPGSYANYPGDPAVWCDKTAASNFVATAVDFQNRTGKTVMITEFGVLRWAKDNDKYIGDLVSTFEDAGISWIFHSVAGWNGWNPTFDAGDPQNSNPFGGKNTPAIQLLKAYWQTN